MRRTTSSDLAGGPSNAELAGLMREIADHLQRRGDSPYRVAAFRQAGLTFARCKQPVTELFAGQGTEGLRELPGIGKSIARVAANFLRRGRSQKLERLRKSQDEESLLRTLPGVGPRIAKRVEEALGGNSLEEVFAAACDGRLRRVPGLGTKRLRALRESLASRLQAGSPLPHNHPDHETPVADLLSIDEEYRRKAAEGRLPFTAPRLFNPTGGAWLPVLRTERAGRTFVAHFANSARSHQLGRFREWVVITCESKHAFGQWTIVTAHRGTLCGKRLVMHREQDCRQYYAQMRVQLELPLADVGTAETN
jgi:DNA polymerase (family X)